MLEASFKSGLKNLTVLVIDDDGATQRLIKAILTQLGFGNIITANNGKKGLEILAQNNIDFIICDWRMPGMTGVEFTRYIRNLKDSPKAFINIIMLTGNSEEDNIIEARDCGVDEYLIKPFSTDNLCKKIVHIIENPRDFVVSANYKGPTRRRKLGLPPGGIERRKANPIIINKS